MRVGHKLHALAFHLLQTAIEDVLLHLEFRNPVAQQSANAVGLLVNRDPVSRAIQLLRRGQTRRARSRQPRLSFPCGTSAARDWIKPSANPRSTMFFSICLIVTAAR